MANSHNSRSETLYRQIESLSESDRTKFVEAWVTAQQTENEFLEFKGGRGDDKANKRNWSVALSGFGNTEGGIVCWGIDSRGVQLPGEPRKIDRASSIDPLKNPLSHVQFLKDTHREATIDPIRDVEHLIVPSSSASGGYVLSLIPPGTDPPYRDAAENQYWQRIGDSFVVIPHQLLRTMFYPRLAPSFELSAIKFDKDWTELYAVNTGKATADDLFVQVLENRDPKLVSPVFNKAYWQETLKVSEVAMCEAKRPLHPNQHLQVVRLCYTDPWHRSPQTVVVHVAIFARNMPPTFFKVVIDEAEMKAKDFVNAERIEAMDVAM